VKSYYYPLMIGGAAVMLLAARSAQAASEKENKSSKNAAELKQEILTEAVEYFENLEQFSLDNFAKKIKAIDKKTGAKKEPAFSKQIDKISLASFSKSSDFDSLLTSKSPQWIAQTPTPPTSNPSSAPMVPQPQVTIQESGSSNPGNTNQAQGIPPTSSPAPMGQQPQITIQDSGNANADPNAIPNQDFQQPTTPVAPVLPRAVAPPVGDIAISNIDPSADLIDLGTDVLVPRLVLRQAPAREVLAVLARYAGLNLVFTDGIQPGGQGQEQAQTAAEPTVSLDLENESVQEVFNSVLLVSGLNANRRGRTIFVGSNLPQDARNLVSRTLRLNQASVIGAGTVLATQGANFQRVITPIEEITDPVTQRVVRRVERPPQIQPITVAQQDQQQGASAPLLLAGLTVTADDRLNSVTLTGDPRQVEIATSMLTQLDARRRQVAVNVKVVDVNLSNEDIFGSSFSFGINDTFFIQDQGAATLRFGTSSPARNIDINSGSGRLNNPPVIPNPLEEAANLFEYPRRFLAQLNAQVTSGNAKILTDPTLVVQEGQEATVRLVQRVLTSVNTQVDPLSGVRTTTPTFEDSGLTLTVNIERIDDNGFVNLSVSPTVAAPGEPIVFDSGDGTFNTLTPLNRRELSSGLIRLRDGQTLIVSGIIQDSDRTVVSKVPILGDIPILGALFRSTDNIKERAEVIILLTPQVIDDNNRSQFGYNYNPGSAASEILNNQGFDVQTNPNRDRQEEGKKEEGEGQNNPSQER
jgi:type IV pilus assembly protein PilQ